MIIEASKNLSRDVEVTGFVEDLAVEGEEAVPLPYLLGPVRHASSDRSFNLKRCRSPCFTERCRNSIEHFHFETHNITISSNPWKINFSAHNICWHQSSKGQDKSKDQKMAGNFHSSLQACNMGNVVLERQKFQKSEKRTQEITLLTTLLLYSDQRSTCWKEAANLPTPLASWGRGHRWQ